MARIPKVLKDFTCFVDGRGYAGVVSELTLPNLELVTEEYRGGGMDSPIDIDMGLSKLSADLKFKEYDPDLFKLFGLLDGEAVAVTLRGSIGDDSEEQPVLAQLRGLFRSQNPNVWQTGQSPTLDCSLTARYYRLEVNNEALIEIDIPNLIRRIGGRDVLEARRQNLGV